MDNNAGSASKTHAEKICLANPRLVFLIFSSGWSSQPPKFGTTVFVGFVSGTVIGPVRSPCWFEHLLLAKCLIAMIDMESVEVLHDVLLGRLVRLPYLMISIPKIPPIFDMEEDVLGEFLG